MRVGCEGRCAWCLPVSGNRTCSSLQQTPIGLIAPMLAGRSLRGRLKLYCRRKELPGLLLYQQLGFRLDQIW